MRDMPDHPENLASKTILLMQDILHWKYHIDGALSYAQGSATFDDIVAKIVNGQCHFYSYNDCFLVMQVVEYPQYKVYHCYLAGGKQEALDDALFDMLSVAQTLGCRHLSLTGRHGWVRRLSTRGWKHVYSTMYLEVPNAELQA